jgi:diadenosine tetraphosphate (Ap4A) HIT family hydrolase
LKKEVNFFIDNRITSTCFELGDWPLSRVLLKDNAAYPWLILVPRLNAVQEIDEMCQESRYQLMNEMSQLSSIVRAYFKPDKLNVAYLGNIVSQLHIHIVARFINDKLWPHSIWQASQENIQYTNNVLIPLLDDLRAQINVNIEWSNRVS